jgi:hypothetical protein
LLLIADEDGEGSGMCRSIVTLRGQESITEDEITAASRQFVRKVSGYRTPSRANEEVFERAVRDIAGATRALLDGLVVPAASRR